MAVWGYVRVSTNDQNTENQKLAVLEYTNKKELTVDHWIEAKASSRKSAKARKLDQLNLLLKGDTLITAELSRLGRSVGQISMIVDKLLQNKIKLICIKENMELTGKRNVQSKVMITMFSLFAEIERDLISERTKEGLARARAEGRLLGRPKGSLGKSKLDGKQGEIQGYFQKGLNKTNIARIYGVSVPTLVNFVRTRGVPTQKAINVELWLEVENNSKYVRGKKRVREEIERFILSRYNMKKPIKNGSDYELTIPYENDKDLDQTIYEMLSEMDSMADLRNCFIETDVRDMDDDRSW